MWAQESGWDTWRARRIWMDQISAYIYSYMCTKYTCVCICRDLGMTAFFFEMFFLQKKKSRRCERKLPIISNLKYKIWAHRPSIKGTKSLFIVIKAIIIISCLLTWPMGYQHLEACKSWHWVTKRQKSPVLRWTNFSMMVCTRTFGGPSRQHLETWHLRSWRWVKTKNKTPVFWNLSVSKWKPHC